jgi:SAM-dependent methyltransferase
MLPVKVACPCCGWEGRRFFDYHEVGYTTPNAACPQCDSHPRHRYLSLWLSKDFKLDDKSGTALVFAAEKALASVWTKPHHLSVIRIDIENSRDTNLLGDIRSLPVAANSVDLIWCHHVLEHVDNDRLAISELHRILRPVSGELIVSVPMGPPGTTTNEYGFQDLADSGHWRTYGDDFEDRLKESGFTVQPVQFDLSVEEYRRYGFEPERFYLCRK